MSTSIIYLVRESFAFIFCRWTGQRKKKNDQDARRAMPNIWQKRSLVCCIFEEKSLWGAKIFIRQQHKPCNLFSGKTIFNTTDRMTSAMSPFAVCRKHSWQWIPSSRFPLDQLSVDASFPTTASNCLSLRSSLTSANPLFVCRPMEQVYFLDIRSPRRELVGQHFFSELLSAAGMLILFFLSESLASIISYWRGENASIAGLQTLPYRHSFGRVSKVNYYALRERGIYGSGIKHQATLL